MRRVALTLMAWLAVPALMAWAQAPGMLPIGDAARGSSAATATPPTAETNTNSWVPGQYRTAYDTPQMRLYQRARFKAQQREARIESSNWFGYSKSRPVASSDPINSDYSMGWVGNNAHYPFRWSGVDTARPVIVIDNIGP